MSEPPKVSTPDYGLENLNVRAFVGRHAELEALQSKLQELESIALVAVSGMGGIGKTALVQQYVRQAKDDYPGGRWYFKVREQNLATQLVSAATVLGWELPDNLTKRHSKSKMVL